MTNLIKGLTYIRTCSSNNANRQEYLILDDYLSVEHSTSGISDNAREKGEHF